MGSRRGNSGYFPVLWKKPEAYSPQKGKFSSWLLVLTRNRSIDKYRSRKRRLDRGETDEILQTRPDQTDQDGAEKATATDEREHLNRAFSNLPTEQKKVLELSYFKGMNQQELPNS